MKDPKICVIPGKKVWILFVDVYILDDGGNLIDASALAAMAALVNTQLKKVIINEDLEDVELLDETEPLPRNGTVASLTFAKINDIILYDANLLEDRGKDARFSVAITDKGIICSMQKGESGVFYESEIQEMLDKAAEFVSPLLEHIESSTGESETNEMFRFNF